MIALKRTQITVYRKLIIREQRIENREQMRILDNFINKNKNKNNR